MNRTDRCSIKLSAPGGRIDAASAPQIGQQIGALADQGAIHIEIDLSEIDYISSSGLRILLLAQRRQQSRGGRLILTALCDRILRVLCIAGFDRVFEIECLSSEADVRDAQP